MSKRKASESGYISIKSLAGELGMDRSHALRYVKTTAPQCAVNIHKRRTADSKGQMMSCVTEEDATKILAKHAESGPISTHRIGGSPNDEGVFYIVRPLPDGVPSRIKVGYSLSIEKRIATYRTICPEAEVWKTWECRRSWELAAIDLVVRPISIQIREEIYECDNLPELERRAGIFFGLGKASSIVRGGRQE